LLDGGEADRLGQMTLPGTGRPEEEGVLGLGNEVPGGELEHEPAIQLLVKVEVKRIERLAAVAVAGLLDPASQEPVLPAEQFVLHERGEEIDRGQLLRLGLEQPRL